MDERCTHPRGRLLKRRYGYEEMVCADCGDSYQVPIKEPLDMRQFGQLRTWLGDQPPESEWSSDSAGESNGN